MKRLAKEQLVCFDDLYILLFLPFSRELDNNTFLVAALPPTPSTPPADGRAGVGELLRPYVMVDFARLDTGQCGA